VKTLNLIRKPFGKASFSPIRHARYLGWEDAFEVEFEDGLCFLEPLDANRKANQIATSDHPVTVVVDSEFQSHFTVTYESGAQAKFLGLSSVKTHRSTRLPLRAWPRRRRAERSSAVPGNWKKVGKCEGGFAKV